MAFAGDVRGLPVNILGAAECEVDHPRRSGAVGDLVDKDEAAEVTVFGVGREGDFAVGGNIGDADRLQVEGLRREMFLRVEVDDASNRSSMSTCSAVASFLRVAEDPVLRPASMSMIWMRLTPYWRANSA
jgi:hypothetical protein